MNRFPVRFVAAAAALALGCAIPSGRGLHPQAAPVLAADTGLPLKPESLTRPESSSAADHGPGIQKGLDMVRRQILAATTPAALAIGLLIGAPTGVLQRLEAQAQDQPIVRRRAPGARRGALAFVRTELFFGTAKRSGAVTPAEFTFFLDTVITPRFPEGLTVTKGRGQFTGEDGTLTTEDAYVVVLLYPVDGQKASSARIDEIRREYMQRHQQESVLRADDPYLVWISF